MQPIVNMALRAAYAGSEKLLQDSDRLDRLNIVNNDPANFSSNIDYEVEEIMIYQLHKAYPDHTIKSRLGNSITGEAGQPQWLIDPLFGSFNYSKGYPGYGISIAITNEAKVNHSVLILPASNEEFVASKGNGAQLNKLKLRVMDKGAIESGLLGLNYSSENTTLMSDILELLMLNKAQIRISGCSALDMLMVCANKLAAGCCEASESFSVQAATLILKESGALIGSEAGDPSLAKATEFLFGYPHIFKKLVRLRNKI